MKKIYFILLCSILGNCSATKVEKKDSVVFKGNCLENLTFKKSYFDQISKVDSLMNIGASRLGNNKSLGFISNYTYVDWASMANYARNYTFGAYEKDRKGWILWYELKKCSNIQFKK